MQRKCVNYLCIYAARMNPAPNGSSTLQHFERGDAIEIRNRMMFDFYPGLPHIIHSLSIPAHSTHLIKVCVGCFHYSVIENLQNVLNHP